CTITFTTGTDNFDQTRGYAVQPGQARDLYQMPGGQNEKTRPRPRFSPAERRSVLALVDDLVGRDPGHHRTQLLTDHFDAMRRVVATIGRHGRVVGGAFGDEHLGVLAVLDALEGITHGSTGFGVDDFRTGD